MKKNKTEKHFSDFWLDTSLDKIDPSDYGINRTQSEKKSLDLIKLSSYKRSISNFVQIVSGKVIPVKFVTKGMSVSVYTEKNKFVQISSKIDEKNFDVVVGLALHEGSHILLSDFDIFSNLSTYIPDSLFDLAKTKKIDERGLTEMISIILNIIEDRYCDNWVFNVAPGYRGYYKALYNKYFHSNEINKALQSPTMYCMEDWESYQFRLISIFNSNNDLNSLKNLRKIYDLIDLPHICRLKTFTNRLELSLEVTKLVLEAISVVNPNKNNNESNQNDSWNMNDGEEGTFQPTNSENNTLSSSKDSSEKIYEENDDKYEKTTQTENKTDVDEQRLTEDLQKIKDFLNGKVKKSPLSSKDNKNIKTIEQSGTEYKSVGKTYQSGNTNTQIECVVVKQLTRELMESDSFPFMKKKYWNEQELIPANDSIENDIIEGVTLGKILGKKLQIRGEVKVTEFTRQQFGKIDRRLINELGFDSESVFSKFFVDKYKHVHLHISVDASGSMNEGEKWNKTMKCIVAICKAADMINNLDVVVDFRGTSAVTKLPYVVVAYNSQKDSFTKILQLFKYIHPNGGTPEGLCFEAILDLIPSSTTEMDSYFVNFSDGQPYYTSSSPITNQPTVYTGECAVRHTSEQVKKMTQRGVGVSSYFIKSQIHIADSYKYLSYFRQMYGKNSSFINVTNMTEVAKSLNTKFLQKT